MAKEITPDRLVQMGHGFQSSKIMMTANELGIFKALGEGANTADEVADGLKLDREATGMLMGALVGLGLVTHKGGKFSNAPDVQKFLASEAEGSIACITRHMNHLYETWGGLDEIVKKGRPKKAAPSKLLTDKKHNRDFICGMFEVGHGTAEVLADTIDLSGVKKMADIGGGPAEYPIAFAKKNTETQFVLADYPNTVKVAKEYVKKYGLEKRIKPVSCEFFDVKELGIGNDFDLALLSQVLHAQDDKKAAELIKKVYTILKPGGRIVINENALNEDRMSPSPPLVFAINMLVQNAGRTFTASELTAWLKAAGFKAIKSKRLHDRSLIIEAKK